MSPEHSEPVEPTNDDGPPAVGRSGRRWLRSTSAAGLFVASLVITFGVARATVTPAEHTAERSVPVQRPVVVHAARQKLSDIRIGTCALSIAQRTLNAPAGSDDTIAVFTKVQIELDRPIASGALIAEISGRPVVALDLPFPLYRDLTPGVVGPDVIAVQAALGRLGRHEGDLSGNFDRQTQTEIERFYNDLGAQPTHTGADLDDAAREAEAFEVDIRTRAATDMTITTRDLQSATDARRNAQARVGVMLRAGEIVIPPSDMTVHRVVAAVGADAGDGAAIAEFRGPSSSASCTYSGPAADGLASDMPANIQTLAGQTLTIEVTAASTNDKVLTVPAGTLREAVGGGSAVAVLTPDGTTRTVPVTIGIVADGQVQISGDLDPGDDLLVSIAPAP